MARHQDLVYAGALALLAEVRRLSPEVSGGQIAQIPRGHFSGVIRYGSFLASSGASGR